MKCNKEIIYNLYYNKYYICIQNTILPKILRSKDITLPMHAT